MNLSHWGFLFPEKWAGRVQDLLFLFITPDGGVVFPSPPPLPRTLFGWKPHVWVDLLRRFFFPGSSYLLCFCVFLTLFWTWTLANICLFSHFPLFLFPNYQSLQSGDSTNVFPMSLAFLLQFFSFFLFCGDLVPIAWDVEYSAGWIWQTGDQ